MERGKEEARDGRALLGVAIQRCNPLPTPPHLQITGANRRRLIYDDFTAALDALADRAGVPPSSLRARVAATGGPRMSGDATSPDYVRFFDDKSTYTGVHARGGPTTVDGKRDLRELCDRSAADVRGVSSTFGKAR